MQLPAFVIAVYNLIAGSVINHAGRLIPLTTQPSLNVSPSPTDTDQKMMSLLTLSVLLLVTTTSARHVYQTNPFPGQVYPRQEMSSNGSSLQVDLGYEVYEGYHNATSDLNTWLGIRFAAPPTGVNRWQRPQPPNQNRTSVIQADSYGSTCYQSPDAMMAIAPVNQTTAAEDCLFLNVWSPSNGTEPLPVFVWIHGGGYGQGSGRQELNTLISANNNSFVGVTIQYRLGAFGFLSSDEVSRSGTPNAGIYDQFFALQWVQNYISLFGGDPSQVTIGGLSAGGGSVMLQATAYGGTLGTSLFQNVFAASPFLPMQYAYNDWIPSQSYYALASAVGCGPSLPYGQHPTTIFECLQNVDEAALANASATVSQSGTYGTWAFLPVTDNALVPERPSQSLLRKRINGVNLLVGNNANEGPGFTPQNITSEDDLRSWLNNTFPLFAPGDIDKILLYYPSSNTSETGDEFSTNGYGSPTALNQSLVGTGQQQRANNIYAETTFVCPAYWMAEAYTPMTATQRSSYKYQYSVPPALHGSDQNAYFLPAQGNIGEDMSLAFKTILGNFITTSNPSIPLQVAIGATAMNGSLTTAAGSNITQGQVGEGAEAISWWPPYTLAQPFQIDLNQTGGVPTEVPLNDEVNITQYWPPGVMNSIGLYNAYTWEGGRGMRCDFWRAMAAIVPE